ncbi:RNA exonuclease 4 [Niveomyces insectorum RCEF 264]|uniref:RNA exonuclease 4 n=1 Tax=Niveomyces insectorum RCEF 264 TaxID=1081102 RepID=A0A167TUQ0_9HYPO|nr:RNA exonuclease 4 [Niveomyces insectorum RCEF 264]
MSSAATLAEANVDADVVSKTAGEGSVDETSSRGTGDSSGSVAGTKRSRSDTEQEDAVAAAAALSLTTRTNDDDGEMENGGADRKKKKKRRKDRENGDAMEKVSENSVSTGDDAGALDGNRAGTGGENDWQTIRHGRPTPKLKKPPKKDSGNYPSIAFSKNARLQSKIQVSDLRNLVTYIFADGTAPQWIGVHHRPSFRKIVAIMVPGLEEAMFRPDVDFTRWAREEDGSVRALERWTAAAQRAQSAAATPEDDCYPRPLKKATLVPALRPFADVFPQLWPVRARGNERYATLFSPVATFLTAPLPKKSAEEKREHKGPRPHQHGSGSGAHVKHKDVRTRITEFLATPEEYLANEFVLHPAMLPDAAARAAFADEPGWVHTDVTTLSDGDVPEAEIEQGSITAGRAIYAVDCEMCKAAGDRFVLTRVSVLAWDGTVVLDELVLPDEPIVDYLTPYSGITAAMLAPVTTTLQDVQKRLLALLDARAILVGHSLDSDCKALQLTHPFVVDTSLVYPHPLAPVKKHALRWLAAKYLNRTIQAGHGTARGHDSVEDARTCLDLVKLKCEKGKDWASSNAAYPEGAGGEGAGENLFHRLARAGTAYRCQGGPAATGGLATGKSTAAVDWGDARRTLCGEAGIVLGGCRSDADVEAGVLRAVHGDPDGAVVPGGGADFVWARFRELEALQGWWNRNKLATLAAASDDQGPPSREMLQALLDIDEARAKEEAAAAETETEGEPATSNLLERCVRSVARRIERIHAQLPPCTALLVFSGSGDPRAMSRLQAQRAQHKREYHTPGVKWDEISVSWTDDEQQLLQRAVRRAREGIAFVTVK